jgi:hypothetical protein
MRFMVIVKASRSSEAGVLPDAGRLAAMGRFNEELVKAGVLLAGDGLKPSSQGVRLHFSGDQRTLSEGPFTPTGELVAGYWVIDVRSLDEAIAWMRRCPNPHDEDADIEIRPVFEAEDFGEAMTPALREQEDRLRDEVAARSGSARA